MPAGSGKLPKLKKKRTTTCTLGELQKQLAELNGLDDRISVRIAELERELSETLGLRIRVDTVMCSDFEQGIEFCDLLAFDKYAGTWHFIMESGVPGDSDSWHRTPLLDCDRNVRADALEHHIPNLIDAAVGKLDARLERRRQALDKSGRLLDAMRNLADRKEAK